MNKIIVLGLIGLFTFACKNDATVVPEKEETALVASLDLYNSYGDTITNLENILTHEQMLAKYETLAVGDTLEDIKFLSTVNSVCSKKGCWMNLQLGDGEKESFVRFKDYGFFVPLDADSSETIVHGRAYKSEITVQELKHYAQDAGKPEEEIAAITEPKVTLNFEADGVLMRKLK